MRPLIFILFAVLIANLSAHRADAAPAGEQRMSHISIQSIGKGEPVVLIPGLASPVAVWDGIVPTLAKDHRVILVQVNGFGGPTGANAKPGILDGIVSDLADYLAEEKVRKPAVIGHSMGGLVGMMLAKAHPDAVGKLMIVDALPFYGALMGPGATPDSVRPFAEQMRTMIVHGPEPTQAPPGMSNSDEGRAKVLQWLKASDRAVVGQAMVEDATTDFTPNLANLRNIPVSVLYAVPSVERKAMTTGLYTSAYASLPSAKLLPVENSAHFIMLDQPTAFAQLVRSFLE